MGSSPGGGRFFAAMYATLIRFSDAELLEARQRLAAQARGRTLEIGAGTGANLRYYGDEVTDLVLTEPNEHMRRRLGPAAAATGLPVRVVDAPAASLGFPDGSFDSVVGTLVLCSVDDPEAALAEARRVLAPGGRLLLFEHIRSTDPSVARSQDKRERLWGRIAGGCHPNRDTAASVRAAGFEFERLETFDLRGPRIVRPHMLATAVQR